MKSAVRGLIMAGALAAAAGLAACAGARMRMLADRPYRPLEPDATVDVYVGEVDMPHEPVAIIETDPSPYVDDQIKERQLAQLRDRARALGANGVHQVRILTKRVRGYVPDARTPFPSVAQGQYDVYFMRGTAIRLPEREPESLQEAQPRGGWAVERLTPPPRLEDVLGQIPMPDLRNR